MIFWQTPPIIDLAKKLAWKLLESDIPFENKRLKGSKQEMPTLVIYADNRVVNLFAFAEPKAKYYKKCYNNLWEVFYYTEFTSYWKIIL